MAHRPADRVGNPEPSAVVRCVQALLDAVEQEADTLVRTQGGTTPWGAMSHADNAGFDADHKTGYRWGRVVGEGGGAATPRLDVESRRLLNCLVIPPFCGATVPHGGDTTGHAWWP